MIFIENQPIGLYPTSMTSVTYEGLNIKPKTSEDSGDSALVDYTSIGDSLARIGITVTYRAIQSDNFVSGTSGWQIQSDGTVEFNTGTFRGSLIAGSIHIPDQDATAASFHVDSSGNAWWGCTETDFNSDADNAKAYIKSTGTAKLGALTVIGDTTNYLTYDGATIESNRLKIIETYTLGETLVTGNVVCQKPGYSEFSITHDSYINTSDGDTHGSENRMNLGRDASSNKLKGFMYADISSLSSNKIIKAVLRFKVWDNDANVNLYCSRVLTSWDESTIAGDNDPNISRDYVGGVVSIPSTASETWYEMDITDIVRAWSRGGVDNHGIRFEGEPSGASELLRIFTSENSGSEPTIRVYTWDDCDGKVYKYDDTDELTSQNVLGIALEGGDADDTARVQLYGICEANTGLTTGASYFASNGSPNLTDSAINLVHPTRLGDAIASDKLFLNIQENQLVEGATCAAKTLQTTALYNETSQTTTKFFAPENATRAIIDVFNDDTNARYQVHLERGTMNDVDTTIYDDAGTAYEDSSSYVWSGATITITYDDGRSGPREYYAYFFR